MIDLMLLIPIVNRNCKRISDSLDKSCNFLIWCFFLNTSERARNHTAAFPFGSWPSGPPSTYRQSTSTHFAVFILTANCYRYAESSNMWWVFIWCSYYWRANVVWNISPRIVARRKPPGMCPALSIPPSPDAVRLNEKRMPPVQARPDSVPVVFV